MFDFLKIILFIAIAVAILLFFVGQGPNFFQQSPEEETAPVPTGPGTKPEGTYFTWRSQLTTPKPKSSPTSPTSPTSTIPDSAIPFGFTREQLSSYFEQIRISSVSRSWGAYTPAQIRLSASFSYSQNESINITGWKIKSNRRDIIIPQAIEVYSPLVWETEKDIILSRNNYVNIYSNTSPFNRNLRLNKCTGYLENIYDFNPSLPQDCPSISRDEYRHLSGQCQSYLMSLGRCKLPSASFSNSLPGTSEGNACRVFLNTISHGSCFQKYRYNADFLSNEWRVWVNTDILDPFHDRILLYDRAGLLVDEYSY